MVNGQKNKKYLETEFFNLNAFINPGISKKVHGNIFKGRFQK